MAEPSVKLIITPLYCANANYYLPKPNHHSPAELVCLAVVSLFESIRVCVCMRGRERVPQGLAYLTIYAETLS